MAKCECGAIWLWDWCHDCYVKTDGEEYKTIEMSKDTGWEAELVQCDCGKINAIMICCDCGGGPINIKEWEKIDWELDEHSYE